MTSILRLIAIAVLFSVSSAGSANAQACKIEKVATLTLSYANRMLAAPARIDGKDVTMGIDTGAQTIVTPGTVQRLHMKSDMFRRTRVIGTAGITNVQNVFLRNLEFAGQRQESKSVAAVSLPLTYTLGKPEAEIAGLIGADVLGGYDIDLDLAGKTMTLYKMRGCTKVPLPWTEPNTAIAVKINSQHRITLPIEIDGHKLTGLLDTGATGFAITRLGALKGGATEAALKADPMGQISGIGGFSKQPAHKFGTLAIGGETFRDLSIQLVATSLDADVLIGQTYLMYRRVWISYSTRMLFVGAPKAAPSLLWQAAPSAFQAPSLAGMPSLTSPCIQLYGCSLGPASSPAFSPVPVPVPTEQLAGTPKSKDSAKAEEERPAAPAAAPGNAPAAAGEKNAASKQKRVVAALPKHEGQCPARPLPLIDEPKRGIVVGYMSREEAVAMMERTQAAAHREISPKYVMNRRVKVHLPGSPALAWVTVVLPGGMLAAPGDRVEYWRSRDDPADPCRYIPNLATKVISSP